MTKLDMIRGDTFSFDVVVSDDSGPVNLTSGLLIFTLKNKYSDPDISAIAQKKSSSNGIIITNALAGKATVTLAPLDTRNLGDSWTILVWDLELILGGNVYTVDSG